MGVRLGSCVRMVLDFVMSRGMMIVAGLLIAGAAAGTYQFFTGIPESTQFDAFARAWVKPFQEAATGTGDAVSTIRFSDDFGVNALPTQYQGHALEVTLYRDAALVSAEGMTRRVPFLAQERMHLWYATNAREYLGTDEDVLDAHITSLSINFSTPIRLVRGPNGEGDLQVYVAQTAWAVEPAVCRFDVDAEGSIDHTECPDAIFGYARAEGSPVAGVEVTLDREGSGVVAYKETSAQGTFHYWPEPGHSNGRERLAILDADGRTGVVLPIVTSQAVEG